MQVTSMQAAPDLRNTPTLSIGTKKAASKLYGRHLNYRSCECAVAAGFSRSYLPGLLILKTLSNDQ